MPYIGPESRDKFKDTIVEVVSVIAGGSESLYSKGEYFGYFVSRVFKGFLSMETIHENSFNSTFFNVEKKNKLSSCSDKIVLMFGGGDSLVVAGDLNYVITSVCWGLIGDSSVSEKASYGFRTYLKGILLVIQGAIRSYVTKANNQKDSLIWFRRKLVAVGVMSDIVEETYRRKTAVYEDEKIEINGDLWEKGELK